MTPVPPKSTPTNLGSVVALKPGPRKASNYVVDYLMGQLFSGELRTGDRLDLEAIASLLGLSHAPVREAVSLLERDGVLVSQYHRGVFVAPFTFGSVVESFELYGLLSGMAASRVAREGDKETLDALGAAAARLRSARSPDEAASLHWTIRSIIHHQGASPRLQSLLRNFGGFLPASFQLIDLEAQQHDSRRLLKVLRAIRAGKSKEAAEAAYEMSSQIGWRVARVLENRGVFEPAAAKMTARDDSDSTDRRGFLGLIDDSD